MLNNITIMGRMVREPEIRQTKSGLSMCNFTLAVDRDFSGQDGEKETDFIDCVAWRQSADFVARCLAKGDVAVASGRLQIDRYTDKDGNKRRATKVNCTGVYAPGRSRREATQDQAPAAGNYGAPAGYPPAAAGGYIPPVTPDEYALLEDDDGQLPF